MLQIICICFIITVYSYVVFYCEIFSLLYYTGIITTANHGHDLSLNRQVVLTQLFKIKFSK